MDPLSITASIVAVLGLTTKAINYLVDVEGAPQTIHSCMIELGNLIPSLISLKDRAERAQSNDPWFEQLRRLSIRDGPLDQYKQALELLFSKLDTGKRLGKIKKQLLWNFEKEEVASIQNRIERLKSLITTALLLDHMALSEAIKADTSFIQTSLLHVQAGVSNLQSSVDTAKNDTKIIRDVQTREQYRTVLEWLSDTNYSAEQQNILLRRQEGTAQWFLDSAQFQQWTQGLKKTLFCPGIPGAGKSMMAAIIVDYLSRMYDDVNIACIFCSYKAQVHQSAPNLMAAILKQLALSSSDAMDNLNVLYDKQLGLGGRPALDELLKTILMCVNRRTTYIVTDALDECSSREGVRNQLIETLLDIQAKSDVRLLFTSRSIPEVITRFRSDLQIEVRASEEDVRRFVDGQRSRLPGCVQRNEILRRDVQNEIAKAVDGMFLLARLHLDSVCAQTSPKKVRAKLTTLQKGSEALDHAYKDALARIDAQPPEHRDLAKRALCWISYAERELTSQELRIALAIEPGESTLDIENLDDLDDLVSFCAGLLVVDRESTIVRLVHYTTQEYLQRVRHTWAPDMQHEIAKACLGYLSFEEFRKGDCTSDAVFEERLVQYEFFDYVARFWSHHVRPVEQFLVKSTAEILCDEALRASIVQVVYRWKYRIPGYTNHHPKEFSIIHLAADVGLCHLLQELLTCEGNSHKNNMNGMDSFRRTPLLYASRSGREQVVKLLLDRGADVNAQGDWVENVLREASIYGHEQVVRLLLDRGADVNARGYMYGSALEAACECGHEQIVRLLLERGAEVNAHGDECSVALQEASAGGHEQIVKLLLDKGANVNAQGEECSGALQEAATNGHEQIVKLLLDRGADINHPGGEYGNALSAASRHGYEQVVRLLLDRGADVNARGIGAGGALHAASVYGHEQVVRLLLERGAEVNAQGGMYGNAFHAASIFGHEQVARLLSDWGGVNPVWDGID